MYKDGSGGVFYDRNFTPFGIGPGRRAHAGHRVVPVDSPTSHSYFDRFARRSLSQQMVRSLTYALRKEQQEAVAMTKAYFEKGEERNFCGMPSRGLERTLTSYDLIRQMGFTKVLIVTNRPSIANSWADDFFLNSSAGGGEFAFVSDTDALRRSPRGLVQGRLCGPGAASGDDAPPGHDCL